jgi:hypothetical protein
MGQIQGVLQQLADIQSGRPVSAAPGSIAAAGATSGASTFASALAAAQGTKGTIGTPSAVTAANPNGATGSDVVTDAKKYLGVPYVWGGTDPTSGFDCSGLVQHVFKDLGVSVPRLVRDQMNAGQTVPSLAAAKPGDLLVMNGVEHIGIYLGNNQYLHAPEPGQKVSIADIPAGAQFDRIVRVVPAAADPSAAAAGTLNSSLAGMLGSSALGGGSSDSLASLLASSGLSGTSRSGSSLTDLVAAARASLLTGASTATGASV